MSFYRSHPLPSFRMRFRSGCCCRCLRSGVSFDGWDAPGGGWGIGGGMLLMLSTVMAFLLCCADGQDALELKYRLEEEQSNGTIVGDVVRDANLGKIYDRAALRQLRFRFLRHSNMFVIDNIKGVIYTNARIDREMVCPGLQLCDIRLDVVIQPQSHFRIIRVTVTLLDVNDNQPRFDAVERTVEVPEMAVVGTVLFVPIATDLDSPENSVQKYMLVSDSDRFELMEHERKTDGSFDTKLVLVRGLDREYVDSYYVKILAVDGGFPQNTGSISINVRVLDVNDNKPVFERSVYNVTVPEDAAPRTTVLRVHAVDKDIDFNGEVSYSFSLQTLASFGHLFGINNNTGDIYIKEALDHESSPFYRLTVVAQDRGFDSVPVSVTVNVFVLDVNDNAPEVTIDTLSTVPGVAEISENSGPGTFVARVTIIDRDSGDMGRFACKLNDSHFEMTPTFDAEYQLVTAMSTVDRESRSEYYLTLTCTDFGNEPRLSVGELKVVVTDINDNDPVFSQTIYRGDLIENNYIGAVLFQVNATDRDAGNNSKIVYRIDGEAASWFHVEQETGLIKASISFDREESDEMRFHIIAADQGVPSRSSSALAHVTILDVNDERPTFSHPGYSFAVQENQPTGAEVGTVAANDRDSSIYGDITYSIVPIHGSDTFDINHKTGMISTLRELDRETHASYTLVVMASDRGVPPLSSTASVTVYVSDENDNPPTFDYPTHGNNTIYVSNRTPKGHVVTRVRAHDLDVGRNAKVVYEISEETKTEMFDLDMELGTVLVTGDLSEMDGVQYLLEFVARDEGELQKMAFARLNIVVNKSVAFLFTPEPGAGGAGGGAMSSHNFMIVVLLAIVSIIIIIVLIVAIVIICKQGRNKQTHKYNCRTETLKMLSKGVKPSQSDGSNLNATAQQHGTAADDRVRRDFVLTRDEQTLEMDDRSLPRYCPSSGDHQMATVRISMLLSCWYHYDAVSFVEFCFQSVLLFLLLLLLQTTCYYCYYYYLK